MRPPRLESVGRPQTQRLLQPRIKQSKMIGVAHEDTPEERRREQPIYLARRGTLLGTRRRHETYLMKAE